MRLGGGGFPPESVRCQNSSGLGTSLEQANSGLNQYSTSDYFCRPLLRRIPKLKQGPSKHNTPFPPVLVLKIRGGCD